MPKIDRQTADPIAPEEEAWTGPVVLAKRPAPPSGPEYQQAFVDAWETQAFGLGAPGSAGPQPTTPGVGRLDSLARVDPAAGDRAYLDVVNDDIARMKAAGIGAAQVEASELPLIGAF